MFFATTIIVWSRKTLLTNSQYLNDDAFSNNARKLVLSDPDTIHTILLQFWYMYIYIYINIYIYQYRLAAEAESASMLAWSRASLMFTIYIVISAALAWKTAAIAPHHIAKNLRVSIDSTLIANCLVSSMLTYMFNVWRTSEGLCQLKVHSLVWVVQRWL